MGRHARSSIVHRHMQKDNDHAQVVWHILHDKAGTKLPSLSGESMALRVVWTRVSALVACFERNQSPHFVSDKDLRSWILERSSIVSSTESCQVIISVRLRSSRARFVSNTLSRSSDGSIPFTSGNLSRNMGCAL